MTRAAVLKTIIYSDIFDYPLKTLEVYRYLISAKPTLFEDVEIEVRNLVNLGKLGVQDGYCFLSGRQNLVDLRRRREALSRERVEGVLSIFKSVSLLPWVRMVALTGAAAVGNCDEEGDVDLMVVTAKGRMWLARFLIFSFLEVLGLKRKDAKRNPAGKICVNLWCDEDNLETNLTDRDLVVAHEIAQARPLVNKGGTYEKFVEKNLWLKNYLPNWSL